MNVINFPGGPSQKSMYVIGKAARLLKIVLRALRLDPKDDSNSEIVKEVHRVVEEKGPEIFEILLEIYDNPNHAEARAGNGQIGARCVERDGISVYYLSNKTLNRVYVTEIKVDNAA